MPIEIVWDDDAHSILVMRIIGDWQLDDFYQKFFEGKALMDASEHPICLILHMSETTTVPNRMMSTASFMRKNRSDNLKLTVFVGASMFVRTLAEVMTTITSKTQRRLYFANDLEQARELIRNLQNELS